MGICVEIEIDDQGQVTVGVCPPEEETGEPKDYMQPADSLEAALSQAQEILSGSEQNSQDSEGAAEQGQEMPMSEEDFAGGFNSVRMGGLNAKR